MTAKITTLDSDYLVREYLAGRNQWDLARELGVSQATIWDRLVKAGIRGYRNTTKINANRIPLQMEEIIRLYLSGKSTIELGTLYGVSRDLIRKRLIEANVPIRGVADADRLQHAKRTPEENRCFTEAAHNATRGRKRPVEERCKQAITREKRISNASQREIELAQQLTSRGIGLVPQMAVGPYNCDLAASPVAVEVWCGNWHFSKPHMARTPERFHYFMDRGWSFLVVRYERGERELTDIGANYIASYIQQARSNPTARREYRVIWCTGEFISAGSLDDDDLTIVETLHGRLNTVSNNIF